MTLPNLIALQFGGILHLLNIFGIFQVHVERSRLESFLHSAEVLKVHGLCDNDQDKPEQNTKAEIASNSAKKVKKVAKSVTTTISPAFPLRPSSRNSPKAGPSAPPTVKSPNATVPLATVKNEPNLSDEENHPEHLVIPSDPNTIRGNFEYSRQFVPG